MGIQWDELLLVRQASGQISTWTVGRAGLAAFNDPRLWHQPEVWEDYFLAAPAPPFVDDHTGLGVIWMDMDGHRLVNMSDLEPPTALRLPDAKAKSTLASPAALRALLASPEHWPHVSLELLPRRGLWQSLRTWFRSSPPPALPSKRITLADLLAHRPSDPLAAVTTRAGLLRWKSARYTLLGGSFVPPGWQVEMEIPGAVLPRWRATVNRLLRVAAGAAPIRSVA